ncbi:phage holin family protein [Curtanaerobium respiraculi]|uniref:phage holin family protein n=1 Tax=Curtanaerobium respiraculi TaxID=2949669 RepID=UPI0024B31FEF|nr:phage holin family protein [Curtanaerobium respiraculi]
MNFVLRWLGCFVAIAFAVWIVPGISIVGTGSWWPLAAVALVLALINVSIKPLMQLLSLPISIVTFGLFALVVNALMLELASGIATGIFGVGISIASFGSAFVAAIIISIVSAIVNNLTGVDNS